MQIHQLQPKHKSKSRKRIGRGGKRGTYSGKGIKGQSCRAGRKFQPIIRELIKRYPKMRGYRESGMVALTAVINLNLMEKHFSDGDKVNPKVLIEKGLIDKMKNKAPKVKILANGEITKKVTVEDCMVSAGAKRKIEKVGGKVNLTTKQFNN